MIRPPSPYFILTFSLVILLAMDTSFAYAPNQANSQLNLASLTTAYATPSLSINQPLLASASPVTSVLAIASTAAEQPLLATQIMGLINTDNWQSAWGSVLQQPALRHRVQLPNNSSKYHYANAWWKPQAYYQLRQPTSLIGFQINFSNK